MEQLSFPLQVNSVLQDVTVFFILYDISNTALDAVHCNSANLTGIQLTLDQL
jgi:hypothetical protein